MFVDEKAVGETAEQKNAKLSLSAAMRIGAALRPKCRVSMFAHGGSCALGAAYEGRFGYQADTGGSNDPRYDALKAEYPELTRVGDDGRHLWQTIYAMNDSNGWNDIRGKDVYTREQIADWLESQGY